MARPAPAGSYAYKTTGSSQTNGGPPKTYPALTFLGVEPPRGTSQEATRDLRDTRGDGQLTQTVLQYRESGVLLESVVIRASQSGYSEVVDLAPVQPALIATGAPKPGDHYEFDLRSRSGGQVDAHAIVDVLRAERVVVGGSEYDTVVTRLDLRLSGHVVGRTVADAWISPENQLALKEHVSGEARSGLNTLSSTYDAVLRDPPTMSP